MKVLALTRYGRLGASSRVRFFQYLPAFSAMGIDVHVEPLLRDDYIKRLYGNQPTNWHEIISDYLRQAVKLFWSRKFDLIWIEKEIFPNFPAWFERVLAVSGVNYVADYDDAIFHSYDLSSNPIKKLLSKKIDSVMRHASLVLCGNKYLADRALSAGARHVEIVPTVIDLCNYVVNPKHSHRHIVIGWIGSPVTAKYLDVVVPALRLLASEFPIQLRVIGANPTFSDLNFDCRAWTEASEVSEIQGCDIGVMPLIDSPWERGKCGYKLIQYMACGLPVVASPVGVNQEIVKHGRNGFLAEVTDEWLAALRLLCADIERRHAIGFQGRKLVEQNYSLQVTAPRLAALFHEMNKENLL